MSVSDYGCVYVGEWICRCVCGYVDERIRRCVCGFAKT